MGQIIELPDYIELKREIRELKNSLENYVIERDELRFVTCRNIKTQYMLEIGALECKVYLAYTDFLRIRRKKELIQAKKNRQEKIIMNEIERALDEEFLDYKRKLEEKIDDVNQAIERSQLERLSKKETDELKKLYRSIVKTLHPDLNPDLSEAQQELFFNATGAYKRGDLDTLQIIFQMIGSNTIEEDPQSSIIELQKEKERYQGLVDRLKAEIKEIKGRPPYIWKAYLEDEQKKSERIAELTKELKSFQEAIRTQQEYINDLMRSQT